MNQLKSYVRTPKGMLVVALAALTGIAYAVDGAPALLRIGLAAGAAVVVDLLFKSIKAKRELPDSALLTGFIVAMVLSPTVPLGVPILAAALAVTSKHLLAGKRGHVLNPAAFGLLITGVLLSTEQSWWGGLGDMPSIAIAAVALAGWFIADRVNKLPTVLTFLGVFVGLLTLASIVGDPQAFSDAFREPMTGAAVYFASFMLTDPPTSPARPRDQVWFAMIAAVVSVLCLEINVGGVYYLLIGLLSANAYEGSRRALVSRRNARPVRAARPVRTAGQPLPRAA
ncbi:MAG TPA: RnfABCDGE type electron transport complex subunit D [Chloroflexota bacterium]|nr:RnfABCDGE type electron transport complex subunit D [Chloroflexota bacterium]